jgi:hypothetical protein
MDRREPISRHREPSDNEIAAVAERLQQLSTDEVERVLRRAIELQTDTEYRTDDAGLDRAALRRVAAEIGIDPGHLESAMIEELLRVQVEQPGLIDRLLAPSKAAVRGAAEGDAAMVREALDRWLGYHAGLRKRAESTTGAVWEPDKSLVAVARMKLRAAQGSGALRTTMGVRDNVHPLEPGKQVVTIEADTSNVRRVALAWLAGMAIAGGAAAGVGLRNDATVVDNVGMGLGVLALGAGGVMLGIRMWMDRIRRALHRAADAVSHPQLLDTTDPVTRGIGRILEMWRSARSDARRPR